jgi:cell division septation protein DedD
MLADSVIQAAEEPAVVYREEIPEPEMPVSEDSPAESKTGVSRYYIVAGCFRNEANADELVQALRNQGFQSEKFGVIGNLHAVCFASFSNKEQAVRELQRIREEVQPEAWMTRF